MDAEVTWDVATRVSGNGVTSKLLTFRAVRVVGIMPSGGAPPPQVPAGRHGASGRLHGAQSLADAWIPNPRTRRSWVEPKAWPLL